jgi:cell pole-organizing protein PopZ
VSKQPKQTKQAKQRRITEKKVINAIDYGYGNNRNYNIDVIIEEISEVQGIPNLVEITGPNNPNKPTKQEEALILMIVVFDIMENSSINKIAETMDDFKKVVNIIMKPNFDSIGAKLLRRHLTDCYMVEEFLKNFTTLEESSAVEEVEEIREFWGFWVAMFGAILWAKNTPKEIKTLIEKYLGGCLPPL